MDEAREREEDRAVSADPLFRSFFERCCEPALTLAREVGNSYSAALYLALASLLQSGVERQSLPGKRVLFCSYGSGASASVFAGQFASEASTQARLVDGAEALLPREAGGRRVFVDLRQYEELHAFSPTRSAWRNAEGRDAVHELEVQQPRRSVLPPRGEFALVRIGTQRAGASRDYGYRYYEYVS